MDIRFSRVIKYGKGDKEIETHEEQYPWSIHLANTIVILMVPNDEMAC